MKESCGHADKSQHPQSRPTQLVNRLAARHPGPAGDLRGDQDVHGGQHDLHEEEEEGEGGGPEGHGQGKRETPLASFLLYILCKALLKSRFALPNISKVKTRPK